MSFMDYTYLMTNVDEIGYKRSSRGYDKKINELYKTHNDEIIISKHNETVLDYISEEVNWD